MSIAACDETGRVGALLLATALAVTAQEPSASPPAVAAPAAEALEVGPLVDLGRWDEVYLPRRHDHFVVRRGSALFPLPVGAESKPVPWHGQPFLVGATIVDDLEVAGVHWLFCNHQAQGPFAVDPVRDRYLTFPVPGLTAPPDRPPRIQGLVALPHLGVVVLVISGGQADKWPRDGNRPVYFRVDLRREVVERVEVGWDLDHFDAGMERASFTGLHLPGRRARPAEGLDLRTGEGCEPPVARSRAPWVPFDWQSRDAAQPVWARPDGRTGSVVGVSVDGAPLLFGDDFRAIVRDPYRPTARVGGGWVALHAWRHGGSPGDNPTLWFGALEEGAVPRFVAAEANSYEVLGPGRVAFTAGRPKSGSEHRRRAQGRVFEAAAGKTWDLLEGVALLPELPAEVLADPGVADVLSIDLLGGRGNDGGGRLVLALCRQQRADLRHRVQGPGRVEHALWHRLVLLTGDGRRLVGELPVEIGDPLRYHLRWLLHSGWLVLGRSVDDVGRAVVQLEALRFRPASR